MLQNARKENELFRGTEGKGKGKANVDFTHVMTAQNGADLQLHLLLTFAIEPDEQLASRPPPFTHWQKLAVNNYRELGWTPQQVSSLCFCLQSISEQTAIISLYNTN